MNIVDTYNNLVKYMISVGYEIKTSGVIINPKKRILKRTIRKRVAMVRVKYNNKDTYYNVGLIILTLYKENPDNWEYVKYLDGNVHNNHILNLDWSKHDVIAEYNNYKKDKYKEIPNYSNYLAGKDGFIYKKDTMTKLEGHTTGGYKGISLYNDDGVRVGERVHRLIALAFIPNPDNLPVVNHKDGVRHHNYVDNLEWVTFSYNTTHAVRTGLMNGKNFNRNESKTRMRNILTAIKEKKKSDYEIAKYYNVSSSTVHEVRRKRRWSNAWDEYYPGITVDELRWPTMRDKRVYVVDGEEHVMNFDTRVNICYRLALGEPITRVSKHFGYKSLHNVKNKENWDAEWLALERYFRINDISYPREISVGEATYIVKQYKEEDKEIDELAKVYDLDPYHIRAIIEGDVWDIFLNDPDDNHGLLLDDYTILDVMDMILDKVSGTKIASRLGISYREVGLIRHNDELWERLKPGIPKEDRIYKTRLDDDVKRQIIEEIIAGVRLREIVDRYDVSSSTLAEVVLGNAWRDIVDRWNLKLPKRDRVDEVARTLEMRENVIRDMIAGRTNRELRDQYGISNAMLNLVRKKESWKDIWDEKFPDAEIPLPVGKSDIGIVQRKVIIRMILDGSLNNNEIGEIYGLSGVTISSIRKKTRWRDVWDKYFPEEDPDIDKKRVLDDVMGGVLTNGEIAKKYDMCLACVSHVRRQVKWKKFWSKYYPGVGIEDVPSGSDMYYSSDDELEDQLAA